MPRPFKLALIQMLVEGGEPEANLDRALSGIKDAASRGAEVVLLPEALNLGWTHPSPPELADSIPGGPICSTLADAARRHNVLLCAGLVEQVRKAEEIHGVYNTAVLISPRGQLLARHRKLNELEIGHPYYAQGSNLQVTPTEFGNIGLMICSDAFAPGEVIARSLCYMGADLILSPCAWAVPADHDNAAEPYGDLWRRCHGAVARDYSVWIAGCSNVGPIKGGPWAGRNCIGCSLVVDDRGEPALQGPYGAGAEEVLMVDIRPVPRPARGDGWARHLERA